MFSHPKLGSDPPMGSDRKSGCDTVTHTYTQNGLAKSLIKCLQVIARSLLMKTKLLTSTWGYAIMHVVRFVRIRLIPCL